MNSFLHEAFPNPNKISFPAMYNMPRLYRGKQLKKISPKFKKLGFLATFFVETFSNSARKKNHLLPWECMAVYGSGGGGIRAIGHTSVSLHWLIQAGRLICGMKPFRSTFHLIPFFTPRRSVREPIWACFNSSFRADGAPGEKFIFCFCTVFC